MAGVVVAGSGRSGPYRADAFRVDGPAGVVAVADGIGSTGRPAAEHALAALWSHVECLADPDGMDMALSAANDAVRAACPDAGTTLTAVAFGVGRATIGHIGDTRAWLFRNGLGTVLTADHTLARSRAAEGQPPVQGSKLEAELQRRLERYIGLQSARYDIDTIDLLPGDVIVICSDGVWQDVGLEEAASVVSSVPVADVPRVLLERSSGRDDATVAVASLPVSVGVDLGGPNVAVHLLPGQEARFGRSSAEAAVHVPYPDNPHLSAHGGTVTATAQGWTLSNVGRYLSYEVADSRTGAVVRVDPGEEVVGTSAQAVVSWHAPSGVDKLTIVCPSLTGTRSPIKQTAAGTTVKPHELAKAPRQILVATALCEPVLLDPTETHIPTDSEVAQRLSGLEEPMTKSRVAKIVNETLLPRILAEIPAFGGRTRAELVRRLLITGTVRSSDLSRLPKPLDTRTGDET